VYELSYTKAREDDAHNRSINTKHIMELMKIENEVMRERLGRLFEAMSSLGEIKILQDTY
jgi:hypothetical protein